MPSGIPAGEKQMSQPADSRGTALYLTARSPRQW
jgi:hypothetical protein